MDNEQSTVGYCEDQTQTPTEVEQDEEEAAAAPKEIKGAKFQFEPIPAEGIETLQTLELQQVPHTLRWA